MEIKMDWKMHLERIIQQELLETHAMLLLIATCFATLLNPTTQLLLRLRSLSYVSFRAPLQVTSVTATNMAPVEIASLSDPSTTGHGPPGYRLDTTGFTWLYKYKI